MQATNAYLVCVQTDTHQVGQGTSAKQSFTCSRSFALKTALPILIPKGHPNPLLKTARSICLFKAEGRRREKAKEQLGPIWPSAPLHLQHVKLEEKDSGKSPVPGCLSRNRNQKEADQLAVLTRAVVLTPKFVTVVQPESTHSR